MNHTGNPHPLEPELVTTGGARSLDDTQRPVDTALVDFRRSYIATPAPPLGSTPVNRPEQPY